MLAALPLICFLCLWAFFLQERPRSAPRCRRTAFLKAMVVLGLLVWLGTELLSLFSAVGLEGLALYWAIACVASAALLTARRRNGRRLRAPDFARSTSSGQAHSTSPEQARLDSLSWAMLVCVAFIAAATGLVALVAPPNTWDSMTYHMSRVAHWAQNRSVAFYPTNIARQNHLGPFAEFEILHLYVLWGGDRLANMVQWCSMLGSLVGVSLIAARLGAGVRGQAFAAVICATIPIGILQASSTQNDYVLAFWLVAFAALILPLSRENAGGRSAPTRAGDNTTPNLRPGAISDWMLAGGALGLAVLTKATAYLYGFPFLLWLVVARLRTRRWRAVGSLFLMAFVALGVNFPHYARNYRLSGSPLEPGQENVGEWEYSNAAFGPRLLVSNVLRNAGLHFARTMSDGVNRGCFAAIARLHRMMGMDLNDPRATWPGTEFRQAVGYSTHEDEAGNPAQALLIVVALGIILFLPRFRAAPLLAAYSLCVSGGFLIFCLYLKWQPWNSRLHLPLFVLASAFVAPALSAWRRSGLVLSVAAVLVALALSPAFRNASRPLVGRQWNLFTVSRTKLYFVNRFILAGPYTAAARYVKERGFRDIGLYVDNGDAWEYPFWVLLGAPESDVRLGHVGVTDVSARLGGGFGRAGPDAVICVTRQPKPISRLKLDSGAYVFAGWLSPVTVLVRAP